MNTGFNKNGESCISLYFMNSGSIRNKGELVFFWTKLLTNAIIVDLMTILKE